MQLRSAIRVLWLAALVLTLGSSSGCDRNLEPYVPGEEPEAPDLSRIFPEATRDAPRPGPAPAAGRGAPPAAGAPIRGTIRLAPELAGQVPPVAVLFLVARGEGGGPPIAVRRFDAPRFPLPFELGPEHRMIQTLPFAGPLQLSARLDGDGNATTRSPGDLQGRAPEPVQPGAEGVVLLIDERLE